VRRDLADVFCTTSEGVRGKRAVDWGLVDAIAPRSKFADVVSERAKTLAAASGAKKKGPGIVLEPLSPRVSDGTIEYRHVTVSLDRAERTATLTVRAPEGAQPADEASIQAAGPGQWSLRVFRELDDALLRLRVNHLDIGVVLVKTAGDIDAVLAADRGLHVSRDHWLANEILRLQARVLRRMDLSAKSFFALIDQGSCFAGCLLELALASDRIYMLADDDGEVEMAIGPSNGEAWPMSNGLSRVATRFLGEPERAADVLAREGRIPTEEADELGLVTVAPDDIDWDDDVRIAIEERASLSPDALTGMEASLRFPGPETMETKIFARLSAWQNWIFQRPNAVGPQGALTKYGQPDRPVFDYTRT
jgi:benzoyl-CoA-dihydrodiol lyase